MTEQPKENQTPDIIEAIDDLKEIVVVKFDELLDRLETIQNDIKGEIVKVESYQKTILEPNQQTIYQAIIEILQKLKDIETS